MFDLVRASCYHSVGRSSRNRESGVNFEKSVENSMALLTAELQCLSNVALEFVKLA